MNDVISPSVTKDDEIRAVELYLPATTYSRVCLILEKRRHSFNDALLELIDKSFPAGCWATGDEPDRAVAIVAEAAEVRLKIRSVVDEHARLRVEMSKIADDDDLFDQGMTSFSAVQVMLAIEEFFDIQFDLSQLRRQVFRSVSSMMTEVASSR